MGSLHHLVLLLLALSVAAIELSIGLDATLEDVTTLVRQPLRLLKAMAAVNLVTPLAAAVLIAVLPLTPASKLALMFMAVAPVPPFAPAAALRGGARRAYAYALYVTLVVLAIAVVPAMVEILARVYGVDIAIGPIAVARKLGVAALLPLAIGMIVRRRFPAFAARAAPVLAKLGMGLVVVAAIGITAALWPRLATLIGDRTALAAILMVVTALVAGNLLGGPDPDDRATLGVTAAMRHPGIAILIATANREDKQVELAIVMVFLAGLAAVLPYQVWLMRRLRRRRLSP
jgi:BASS family bile acid:Na+ symporter